HGACMTWKVTSANGFRIPTGGTTTATAPPSIPLVRKLDKVDKAGAAVPEEEAGEADRAGAGDRAWDQAERGAGALAGAEDAGVRADRAGVGDRAATNFRSCAAAAGITQQASFAFPPDTVITGRL